MKDNMPLYAEGSACRRNSTRRLYIRHCNKIIELALLTLIIVTPLLFSKETESTFLITKETFSKSVILFMAMVWLIKISNSGEARICPSPLNLPLLFLILVAFVSLVNLINSSAIHLSLWDLSNLICFIILYFIINECIKTKGQIERILIIFVLIGGFTALYGVLQYYGIDYFHYWVGNVGRKSMFSTFGNPNFVAEYHIAILPSSLIFLLFGSSLWKKVIGGIGFVIASLCLLISQTRGSWVGFALSLVFLCTLLKLKDRKVFADASRTIRVILILAIIILLGFGVADLQKHGLREVRAVVNRACSIITFGDEFRRFVWQATILMIKEHPFRGVGLGGFKQRYPEYQAKFLERNEYPSYVQGSNVPQAHNEFLQVWAEMGILGVVVVMWLVVAFFYQGIATLKKLKTPYMWKLEAGMLSGCFAVFVHAIASFPFHLASTASVFVPLCSLISIMGRSEEAYSNKPYSLPRPGSHLARRAIRCSLFVAPAPPWIPIAQILIIVLTLICTVITFRPIMADIYLKISGAFLKERQWNISKEYITRGISLNPYDGKLHFALASVYNGEGDNDKSIYELRKSLETFKDVSIHSNLGLAYIRNGMSDEAIAEWEKAVAVRPDLIDIRLYLAKAYENKGMLKESKKECNKAIWFVKRAIEIDPENNKLKEQYEMLKNEQEKKERK